MIALNTHNKKRAKSTYRVSFFDRFMYLVALSGPIMTIPQVSDVWIHNNPVNTITWTSYFLIGLAWLIYGIAHKEKPIIISNSLGVITTGLIILGTIANKGGV